MRRSLTVRAALAAAGVAVLLLVPVSAHAARPASIALVDAAPDATAGNGGNGVPDISGNGRYVAFVSDASNLVPGDTDGSSDVFVYDRRTRATTRASVFAGGRQIPGISTGRTTLLSNTDTGLAGDGASFNEALSAEGRRVVFTSNATNLGVDPGDGHSHIFVRSPPGH